MKRLSFRLPEYAPRTTWSSAQAREVWEPRIRAVSQAWVVAERDSVAAGVRPSALQHVSPEGLPELMKVEAARGLIVLPIEQVAKVDTYRSGTAALLPGGSFEYKCVITRPEHAAAWAKGPNDDVQGELLGTPLCCRLFFDRVWTRERWIDTTWPMYGDAAGVLLAQPVATLNMLLRWHGVRPVSHLPCSPDCVETLKLAEGLAALLPEPVRSWHRELLSWPTLYTSLHGIAEITTPIMRTSVATDALAEKAEVRYLGTGYPAEGARGLGFPFRQEVPVKPLMLVLQNVSDNGFSSREAQDAAHKTLLSVAGSRTWRTVVDLGAGNGTLLMKMPAKIRIAIESDPKRATHIPDNVTTRVVDCTQPGALDALYAKLGADDLVIAQAVRNPPGFFARRAFWLLSYSYEPDATPPQLLPPKDSL